MANKKILYIMCGIPGSGKSTYVKNTLKDTEIHISRDSIRYSLLQDNEDYFSHEVEVKKHFFNQIKNALKNPKITAVYADATHLTQRGRQELIQNTVKDLNADIIPIVMNIPLKICLERNNLRQGRERVPDQTIIDMYSRFTHPKYDLYAVNYYHSYINISTR